MFYISVSVRTSLCRRQNLPKICILLCRPCVFWFILPQAGVYMYHLPVSFWEMTWPGTSLLRVELAVVNRFSLGGLLINKVTTHRLVLILPPCCLFLTRYELYWASELAVVNRFSLGVLIKMTSVDFTTLLSLSEQVLRVDLTRYGPTESWPDQVQAYWELSWQSWIHSWGIDRLIDLKLKRDW